MEVREGTFEIVEHNDQMIMGLIESDVNQKIKLTALKILIR